MKNLKKIFSVSILFTLILFLSAANTVRALGVSGTITVGTGPNGVAYDSGKGEVFVTNSGAGTVSVISDRTNNVIATVPLGENPGGIAYDSGKGKIFVTNAEGNTVSVISDRVTPWLQP